MVLVIDDQNHPEPRYVLEPSDIGNIVMPLTVGSGSPVGNVAPVSPGHAYFDQEGVHLYFATGSLNTEWQMVF